MAEEFRELLDSTMYKSGIPAPYCLEQNQKRYGKFQ